MRNGIVYPLPPLVRPTSGNGSSSSLWPTPRLSDYKGSTPHTERTETGWKVVRDKTGTSFGAKLSDAVAHEEREPRLWPTPTARDHKDGSYCPNVEVNGLLGRAVWGADSSTPPSAASGSLNPTWVEWLMGFPLEWTVLKD